MDRRVLALVALAGASLAGCYRPSFEPCDYACSPAETCPAGLHCAAGLCVAEGQDPATCAAPEDAQVDAPLPARCAGLGGPPPLLSNVDVCALEFQPAQIIDWVIESGDRYEISNGELRVEPPSGSRPFLQPTTRQLDPSGIAVAVIVVKDLVLRPNADLVIDGEQPLVIVAFGEVEIEGRITYHDAVKQPCADGAGGPGGPAVGGQGGGGGGGFGGTGRAGGLTSAPGQREGNPQLVPLRGGCPGGGGGGTTTSPGGHGGGALQISARSITLASGSIVDVAGRGGEGGAAITSGGGGGGGSGGALLLEAPSVTRPDGAVLCLGGGGGGGGGGTTMAGTAGSGTGCLEPAAGGVGLQGGGNGGAGGDLGVEAGEGDPPEPSAGGGAGGGGGGAGRLFVRTSR